MDAPEYDIDFKNVSLDKPFTSMETLRYYGRLVGLGMLKKVKFFPNVILASFALSIPFISARSFLPQSLMEKEALACGVPVITEFWEGENATKQPKKLQHKSVKKKFLKIFDSLIENEKMRNTFSKNARIVAEKDFSYVTMGTKYRKIPDLTISENTCA